MSKNIFLACLVILFSTVNAQVSSELKKVKVFQNGAQIYRSFNLNIKKGTHKIIINQLSSFVNPNTIQATIKGVKILDINYNINYLEVENDNTKIKTLKESIKKIKFEIQKERNNKSSLMLELDLILNNQDLKGQETLIVEDLKEFIAYYKSIIPGLKSKITDTENQINKFLLVKSKLDKQLSTSQKTQKETSGVILIKVISDKSFKTTATLNYHTSNCGWTPIYSLRATDLDSPINFEYAGNVYQNTGVLWENAPIILVTGNPVLTGNHPELNTWFINNKQYERNNNRININKDLEFDKRKRLKMSKANTRLSVSEYKSDTRISNLTFSEFKILQKHTIESGAESTRMVIDRNNLPASFEYYCAPKISSSVYLIANISGWEKLSLIPGKANIYFNNTYVGKSYINPGTSNDTLEISLGQDQRIAVKREKIANQCKSKTIGFSKKHTRAYRIEIKNNRNNIVKIRIMDQIPVSSNEKIEVEITNTGGAKHNKETGALEWDFEIDPVTLKRTSFEFEVKHPRRYNVAL